MESAHPVPQNVTSFEFHLIGDMTLRQFFYLAIGVSIAYFSYIFFAVKYPYVAWPVIVISASIGSALAFLPISDRPLDHWLKIFFKAIYSPTKLAWVKNKKSYNEDPLFPQRLSLYLSGDNVPIQAPLVNSHNIQPQPVQPSLPTAEELTQTVELAHKAQGLQVKIIETERELSQIKTSAQTGTSSEDYTKEFNTVFENMQKLVEEANGIKSQLSKLTNEPVKETGQIKIQVVTPLKPIQTQISLTTFPNVINGIVVDSLGNYLDGSVVVIHDKEGLPVRALKTNKLGQFTGSTPLPNGTYTVEIEKDSLVFDILQVELTGKVLPPLIIAAKKIAGSS